MTPDAKLTSDRVREVFVACVGQPDCTDCVTVEGIVRTVPFSPAAILTHKAVIAQLLAELPEPFHASTGGGWSFLNACNDRHGNQWTGLHQVMEELFMLGMAAGLVRYVMPREMWDVLPGGMPYLVVDRDGRVSKP